MQNTATKLAFFGLSVKTAIVHQGDLFLIRRSSSSHDNAGYWDLPGGKVIEPQATNQSHDLIGPSLLRELSEEIGDEAASCVSIDYHCPLLTRTFVNGKKIPYVQIVYPALLNESDTEKFLSKVALSDEHDKAHWEDAGNPEKDGDYLPWIEEIRENLNRLGLTQKTS